MKMRFECILQSDVILNRNAATEGNNNTLDFIPGNVFLGIVASRYSDFSKEDALTVFHSGRVRFGDAHPESPKLPGVRTLRIPASLYYPKMKSMTDVCYVHHFYDRSTDRENDGNPQQLKQCRNGFFAFCDGKGFPAEVEKSFALKSAYDRGKRRSEDEKMFGYESLDAGKKFFFEVEVDDERLAGRIKALLLGRHHVGRSRTAQYGEVEICENEYREPVSREATVRLNGEEYITVYADGRLIFIDDNAELTLKPAARDLGIEDGEIDWTLSQVRTFQYAPWNGKRSTRDAERFGIEKGSVFLVKVKTGNRNLASRYVGVYRNEGFGKVLYNPDFLEAKYGQNGLAKVQIQKAQGKEPKIQEKALLAGTPLLDFVARKLLVQQANDFIYDAVNNFADNNRKAFSGGNDKFASQWGQIREIAARCKTCEKIEKELLDEKNGYLYHGVAMEKWKLYGRRDRLKKFIEKIKDNTKYGDILGKALVNLSSEMAKMR